MAFSRKMTKCEVNLIYKFYDYLILIEGSENEINILKYINHKRDYKNVNFDETLIIFLPS